MLGQGTRLFTARQRARQPAAAGLEHQRAVIRPLRPRSNPRAERRRPKALTGRFDQAPRAELCRLCCRQRVPRHQRKRLQDRMATLPEHGTPRFKRAGTQSEIGEAIRRFARVDSVVRPLLRMHLGNDFQPRARLTQHVTSPLKHIELEALHVHPNPIRRASEIAVQMPVDRDDIHCHCGRDSGRGCHHVAVRFVGKGRQRSALISCPDGGAPRLHAVAGEAVHPEVAAKNREGLGRRFECQNSPGLPRPSCRHHGIRAEE